MNRSLIWLRLLVAAAVLAAAPALWAAEPTTVDPDAKCLKCHSKKLKKQLEDGETMFLQVNGEAFGESVHRVEVDAPDLEVVAVLVPPHHG